MKNKEAWRFWNKKKKKSWRERERFWRRENRRKL